MAQQQNTDDQILIDVRITCDGYGRVKINGELVGGVDDEGDHGWTAASFFEEDLCWDEAVQHDHPYSSRGEAVRAIVTHRWELLERLEQTQRAHMG